MPISTVLPLPPSGTPFVDPATGAVSPQWANYLLALENALGDGVPPINAQYWLSTANSDLTNERNLGALSSGHVSITTVAGVATPSTSAQIPATDLSGILPVANGGTGTSSLGSDTQVLFNDGGAAGGDAGLTYAKTTDTLTLAGPLNIAGAAAGQIVFPATQNASTNANTLDDYEEGTWTPVIGGSGGTSGQTYAVQFGRYIKVGKLVVCQFNAVLSAEGTVTDSVQIQGLPFTVENTTNSAISALAFNTLATNWVDLVTVCNSNASSAGVTGTAAAGTTNRTALTAVDIGDTSQLVGTISYRATD